MTLREALAQRTYPEGHFTNGWYRCSDGRVYHVIYAIKEELISEEEKEGYYLVSYPVHFESSKFPEVREQIKNYHFQTFQELEDSIIHEHCLKSDEGWYPNMNPFEDEDAVYPYVSTQPEWQEWVSK